MPFVLEASCELQPIRTNCAPRGLSESAVRDISFQIIAGLQYLNSHGLVHRNLSLENILIDKSVGASWMSLVTSG